MAAAELGNRRVPRALARIGGRAKAQAFERLFDARVVVIAAAVLKPVLQVAILFHNRVGALRHHELLQLAHARFDGMQWLEHGQHFGKDRVLIAGKGVDSFLRQIADFFVAGNM